MGLFGFIKKQFIDVIQWENPQENVLVWRFPMADQEIQNGASLTVRESQIAVVVDEGRIADIFMPGLHKLTTSTLPVLTNLRHWSKLFESPFKTDVYFFNTKLHIGRSWGTAQPITVRDPEFGLVSLRAFGMYSYRIKDPEKFFLNVCGVCEWYGDDALEIQFRNVIVTNLASVLGSEAIPFIELAANQVGLSEKILDLLQPSFAALGLSAEAFSIESITLPEDLKAALADKTSMGILGNLGTYTQFQTAKSIPLAAENEGGIAGIGAGLAVGMGMGQNMSQAMGGNMAPIAAAQTAATAPIASENSTESKLIQIKSMLDKGLISDEEFQTLKAELLKKMIE